MIGIVVAFAVSVVVMGAMCEASLPPRVRRPRRRPFRLGAAWYHEAAPRHHEAPPDPGRDWTVA